jgi:transposase
MSKKELTSMRRVGRPSGLDSTMRTEIGGMLKDAPDLPGVEILRRLTSEHGYRGGKTAVYDYLKTVRPPEPMLPIVRFEGLPGEFAQHDFGEVNIRYEEGGKEKLCFYAGRLKFSRYMHVVTVPNQSLEHVIRGMLSFADKVGGMAVINVWDRPKTVVTSQIEDPLTGKRRPVYNPKFERFIRECQVLVELCAPASGNQKGSVENLVKFVKNGFFFARRFKNRADLERQLEEWLEYVNERRPCAATGEIPSDRLKREQDKLRSIPFSRDSYGIFEMRTVSPSSEVSLEGIRYRVAPEWIGQNVEVRVYPQVVKISYCGKCIEHPRFPENGKCSILPEQRASLFTKPRGEVMAKRQMLMDVCPEAESFFTEMVHKRPMAWREVDLPRIWNLYESRGEKWMREAFIRCVAVGAYGAEYLEAIAQEVAA